VLCAAIAATAQTAEPETRQAAEEQAEARKAATLHPIVPTRGEQLMARVQGAFVNPVTTWHPFFDNAYRGGGFALGAGYMQHVGEYTTLDMRGSYSIRNYKRLEAEFLSQRLFRRRAELSVLGGWREATEVGFYGTGTDSSPDNRANYGFRRPYGSALLTMRPTRRLLVVGGGVELTRWNMNGGTGSRSVEDVYTPDSLPGLGAETTYLHTQATAGFDWRPSHLYARRGGFYGVTAHDYTDRDDRFGFRQVDYEIVQHLPILRETWVLTFRGKAETTFRKGDQNVPFFMLPSLGGGTNLRGYSSWRFRDRQSLLLQAEWRIMVNRYLDTALFYDTGKVTSRTADLDLNGLKSDYGFGLRFHTPLSTVLRIDIARSDEETRLVFATHAAF
jgi:hypothetical protein